jgi:uncharacterized protein YxjI
MPGDPQHMSPELRYALEGVLEGPGLAVRQQQEWGEILMGWETRNRYEVSDANRRPVLYVGETGEGVLASLIRNIWPFRSINLELMTLSGTLAMRVIRPWTLFFARVDVSAWDGRLMGQIQQRFRLFGRRFDILSAEGALLATIDGPLFHPWTFHVHRMGSAIATIRKQWSGLGQEMFSDADNFGVRFHAGRIDGRLRQLVLAATFVVDLVYFENRQRRRSSSLRFLMDD